MAELDPDPGAAPRGPSLRDLLQLVPTLVGADPATVATRLQSEYGYVVHIPPVHPALDTGVYLLTDPEDVRFVLQTHPTKFGGLDVPGSDDFGQVVGDSIVSLTPESDGSSWVERTRMLGPEFAEPAVRRHAPAMAETTMATLGEFTPGPGRLRDGGAPASARVWTADGEGVRLLPAMRRLTLRLLGVSLFGADMRTHEVEVIEAVDTLRSRFKQRQLGVLASRLRRRLPDELHFPSWLQESLGTDPYISLRERRERGAIDAIESLGEVAEAVAWRREQVPRAFDDGLATWLTRPDPVTGETLSPETLRQEVVGLLIAGHATTSAALAWAFYLLASRPGAQERIHEEAREVDLFASLDAARAAPPRPDADGDAAGDALAELPYTRRVFEETLRLYPPLPMFGRTAEEDVDVGGTELPAGANVLLSPYVTHRDERVWEDPERFDPGRFTPERVADRPEFAYFPFSGGPHACLGEAVATSEALVVLATTLATHRVEFATHERPPGPRADPPAYAPDVGVDSAINLQPDREVVVRFRPRK